MKPILLCYPKCDTCRKAIKWLKDNGLEVIGRDIADQRPAVGELTEWIARSGLPVKKFFNTSGLKYKELKLKDRVATEDDATLIALLATDGMLVKRPLLVSDKGVLVGFKPEQWEAFFKE